MNGDGSRVEERAAAGEPGPMSASDRFRAHMRKANALVAERQLAEAEAEIVTALDAVPDDLRALKLLALVRFRLGRLAEAGAAYELVTRAAPDDAAARLNLGLIALKLENFGEAARELAAVVELRPDDRRAHGYLAYALAREGRKAEAARAFRRAGQPDVAAQLEAQLAGRVESPPALATPATPSLLAGSARGEVTEEISSSTSAELATAAAAATDGAEALAGAGVALASFVLERMITPEAVAAAAAPGARHLGDSVLRVPIDGEGMVSAAALVAASGGLILAAAHRRRRGRETAETLSCGGVVFFRCRGQGELWVGPGQAGGRLEVLELEDDVLFLRESLVRGFAGPLVWDSGAVPRTQIEVMHFHGSGRLLLDWGGANVLAVRLTQPQRLVVPEGRLLGWLGGIVAHAAPGTETGMPAGGTLVACEGEGVLLIARHGQPIESVHQRAQSGDNGAGSPHPGHAVLHR